MYKINYRNESKTKFDYQKAFRIEWRQLIEKLEKSELKIALNESKARSQIMRIKAQTIQKIRLIESQKQDSQDFIKYQLSQLMQKVNNEIFYIQKYRDSERQVLQKLQKRDHELDAEFYQSLNNMKLDISDLFFLVEELQRILQTLQLQTKTEQRNNLLGTNFETTQQQAIVPQKAQGKKETSPLTSQQM